MSEDPLLSSVPSTSQWVEVSGKKAVLRIIHGRDKAGKPIMMIREPRIRLDKGGRLLVSTAHVESPKDQGDGIIFATGNIPYYFILDEAVNGDAAGLFVRASDVRAMPAETVEPFSSPDQDDTTAPVSVPVDLPETESSLTIEVSAKKAVLHSFTRRDKAGKPIMVIREPRIRLERGSRLDVSASRSESDKDKGDGIIHGTGNIEFYFVLDQPSNGEAAGLYVKAEDVKLV